VSEPSRRGDDGWGYRSKDVSELTYEGLVDMGWMIVGSPDTVAERLEELPTEMGAGRVILSNDFVSELRWMLEKALTISAEQVMPRFRLPGGEPVWARARTVAGM
jgi:alkanesulfonate monooxygenase SsuD/methylene tetrahydromethanopterin reductase-like flavin-dependent oxidoreductase (luciferase family)